MALPVGVTTATVTWGSLLTFFGEDTTATVTIQTILGGTARAITWEATGQTVVNFDETVGPVTGVPASWASPHVDQDGWRDGSGNEFKDWSYRAQALIAGPRNQKIVLTKTYQVIEGQTNVDLDNVPDGTVGAPGSSPVPAVTSVNGETGAVTVEGADDATIAGFVADSGSDTAAALNTKIAADFLHQRFGASAGRTIKARLGGRTAGFGSVTTNLTQNVASAIPLAETKSLNGLKHTGNSIVIPAGEAPAEYEISIGANFTGGSAGIRRLYASRNGAGNAMKTSEVYGSSVSVTGSFKRILEGGDVITLHAYTDQTGVSVVASGADDVFLEVSRVAQLRVKPTLIGNSGLDIAGMENKREIYGHWLNRATWADVGSGSPLPTAGTAYRLWLADNMNRAVELGVPLIPHGQPSGNWSALLDEGASGARDAEYTGLGAALATYGADTVYARPWWEFNIQGQQPNAAKFIACWDHAIPVIRAGFAAAARPGQVLKIAWCFGGQSTGDPLTWWPASNNVDLVTVDSYAMKWGTSTPALTTILTEVTRDLLLLSKIGADKEKPVAISEWASMVVKTGGATDSYGLGDVPQHIDLVMDWAERSAAEYLSYFNLSTGGVGQTMADEPNSRARYLERRSLISKQR